MQEFKDFFHRLEASKLPYCVVGGLASILYGTPRLTLDADLVISLVPGKVRDLIQQFPPELFYLPPEDVLIAEAKREARGHFNIIHQKTALKADCYLPGNNELARWELVYRRRIETDFGDVWVSPPEAVVVNKLIYYREGKSTKHLDDIRGMLEGSVEIDRDELKRWIAEAGVQEQWEQLSS